MKECWLLFKYYRTRTILSLLGIVIGVAAFTILGVIQESISQNTEALLARQGQRLGGTLVQSELHYTEYAALKQDLLPNLHLFSYRSMPVKVNYQYQLLPMEVVAVSSELFEYANWGLKSGRYLENSDQHSKVILAGSAVGVALNDWVSLGGEYYHIIGILEEREFDPVLQFDVNYSLFLHESMIPRFEREIKIKDFLVYVKNSSLSLAEKQLKQKLSYWNKDKPIFIRNPLELQKSLYQQIELTLSLLKFIAALALFLGTISTINLFLILLEERKPEMGIRFAMGATLSQLGIQFFQEALYMGLIGGTIGILVGELAGWGTMYYLKQAHYWSGVPVIESFMMTCLISVFVGSVPMIQLRCSKTLFRMS